jgi:hypothetical protein
MLEGRDAGLKEEVRPLGGAAVSVSGLVKRFATVDAGQVTELAGGAPRSHKSPTCFGSPSERVG